MADARITARFRGERETFRDHADALIQVLRLCWNSDAFAAHVLYRAKAAMQRRRIPILPRLCHHLSMMTAQVSIGDPVVMQPGVYIVHGQIVLDGLVEVSSGCVIAPWVSIGLRSGNVHGPKIEENVFVGTGAAMLGPMQIGAGAQIGAGSVVTGDVEPGAIVGGIPAEPLPRRS